MTQTERDAQIDSLLADNTAGDISAKDMRDVTKQASIDIQVNTDNGQAAFNRIDSLGLDASGNTLLSNKEVELLKAQVVPTDPVLALASKKLMTVGNVFKAMNDFKTVMGNTYEAVLGKPGKDDQILSSKKDGTRSWIDAPSGGAGIDPADQVKLDQITVVAPIDLDSLKTEVNTNHNSTSLNDASITAINKKVDHISVTKDVDLDQMATLDDVSSAGGLFQFDYKIEVGTADATPAAKKLAFNNGDPKLATKIYINKTDRTNTDMSLFLKSLKAGDYLNLHDNNNINDFIAYDVSGAAVQSGDVFTIPVTKYDDNGTLTNGERVFVHWNATVSSPKLDHITVTKDIDLDTVSTVAHLHGTTVPADTLGKDGDTYFKIA